jgi:hypothetical protein
MRKPYAALFFLALGIGSPFAGISDARAANSGWVADGVSISPTATNYKPFILSDGAGGSIISWYGGSGSDIFAQRLLVDGSIAPGWPLTGPLTISAAPGLQELPVMVSDLAGGALVFWQDARNGGNYDIYGQHVTSTGQIPPGVNWVPDGNAISSATGNQYTPVAVSDGSGGAIVVWQDGRRGAGNYDIYAQHIDGDGNLLWAPSGVPVCVATNNQINPTVISDGNHGVFIGWQDYRKGTEYDVYVQHLAADGSIFPASRFVTDGIPACSATNSQYYPALTGDGAGGAYVAWQDFRTGTDNHIFAQHLNAGGDVPTGWPVNGTPVCQATFSQYYPVVTSDGGTGLFVAWQDYRNGTTNHIYAQHLTTSNVGIVPDGVPISSAINGQFSPQIATDGTSGAFVTWYDARSGSTNDVYVQHLDQRGTLNPGWDVNGLAVCVAPNTQQFPVVTTARPGTAILTWQDLRSGGVTSAAIFAQQAVTTGITTAVGDDQPVRHADVSFARPNPSRGPTQVELTLPQSAFVHADVLDLSGRRVATLAGETFSAGTHSLSWNGNTAAGERAAPGVYLVRVRWPGFERTQRIVRLR